MLPFEKSFLRLVLPTFGLGVLVAVFGGACDPHQEAQAASAEPAASSAASAESHGPHRKAASSAEAEEKDEHGEGKEHKEGKEERAPRFSVPFVPVTPEQELKVVRDFLRTLRSDNMQFMAINDAKHFAAFAKEQKPRATVVMCSDSRVQTTAFAAAPENDVFMIRNIGNQMASNVGSVEYGVEHLKTPLLVILGHTACGAIKAAQGDTSKLSPAIRKEVESLRVAKADPNSRDANRDWIEGVYKNVNDQVQLALGKFTEEVQDGKLTVIGAVYDFRNDLKQGNGKVQIINVNGSTDPQKLAAFEKAVSPL